MSAISILLLSGLLGILSSSIYFFVIYRNMNIERNRLVSDVDRLENEFLNEFRQIDFRELKETAAGRELLELLQDSEIFPKNLPTENSSLKYIVLKSVQTMQTDADRQNVDFHVDIIDPPSFSETKGKWQIIFDQLIHDTIKYSLRGQFGRPNIIRIYGRKGENHYIITLENYGENLKEKIFKLMSFSDFARKKIGDGEVSPSHRWTMTGLVEQAGGKIIINKVADKSVSETKDENSVNQIMLYIPMKPAGNK